MLKGNAYTNFDEKDLLNAVENAKAILCNYENCKKYKYYYDNPVGNEAKRNAKLRVQDYMDDVAVCCLIISDIISDELEDY